MTRTGRIAAAALALVGAGVVATSCAATRSTTTAPRLGETVALASWGHQHAEMFSTLSYDTGTVADDASTYDTGALVGACQTVSDDVQEYLALPPVPDVVAARHLRAALELFGRGTGDCISGAVHHDRGLIVQARRELDRATRQLETARGVLVAAAR
ncbi:MAG: hypothetical protein E6G01_07975 [Actinobacteria bacterium]|nr:MAG: hypothetical protein E6G01_07975 [Actinomycetota bacterium]